jgi:hypothetical protein
MPDERIGLEKQVQRLSEMLHESEDKVVALKSQEKVIFHFKLVDFILTRLFLDSKR